MYNFVILNSVLLFSVTYWWCIDYETKLSLSALKMFKYLCLLFILQIRYPANKPISAKEYPLCVGI